MDYNSRPAPSDDHNDYVYALELLAEASSAEVRERHLQSLGAELAEEADAFAQKAYRQARAEESWIAGELAEDIKEITAHTTEVVETGEDLKDGESIGESTAEGAEGYLREEAISHTVKEVNNIADSVLLFNYQMSKARTEAEREKVRRQFGITSGDDGNQAPPN